MNFIIWTPKELEILIKMTNEGHSTKEIQEVIAEKALNKEDGFPIVRSVKAIDRKRDKLTKSSEQKDEPETIDARWLKINALQKAYYQHSKFLSIGITKSTRKILTLSDIHFPFARTDFLHEAIKEHADADIGVLNGDILDGYMYSAFEKDSLVAAIDEYMCAFEFVYLMSRKFPKIVVIGGNHDIRAEKFLKRLGVSHDGIKMFGTDLLARIANGECLDRNGTLIKKVDMPNVYYPATEPWWVQIGKTLFIHPHSRGSSKPAYTVSSWAKKFQDRLPPGSFDSIVSGHTHQCSKHIQSNLLLIEQGCLCNYMSYSWQPRDIYHSSAMSGYAVIYQDKEGNTDFNSSTFKYLGQLLPVDKPMYNSAKGYTNKDILFEESENVN